MHRIGRRGVALAVMAAAAFMGSLLVAPTAAQAAAAPACATSASVNDATQQACGAIEPMAIVTKTVFVTSGDWRTLETFFNASGTGVFRAPAGAQIKVRYGVGIFGFDRQRQTLDGGNTKRLTVSSAGSLGRARMQIRVSQSTEVTYSVIV